MPIQRTHLAAIALLLLASHVLADEGAEKLNFVPLFNGKDLSGWVPMNVAPNTFTVKDGVIHSTGVPTGIMRTERQYENFVIELDWMHEKPAGNAGLFLWGAPMTAQGTPFAKGIEVQILDDAYVQGEAKAKNLYTGHGDIFSIHGASMKPDRPHPAGWERCLPSENRAKPAGQWNHYRVEARDGVVKLSVNGKVVSGATECRPRKGYICLESEGSPAQFKNIRIAELPSTHPKPEEIQPEAEGFTSLYTGVDLSNWVQAPGHKDHWKPGDWILHYDGKSTADDKMLWTEKAFGDFEMSIDWRVPPRRDAAGKTVPPPAGLRGGVSVRGHALLVPLKIADDDKSPDRWNRTVITMKGDRLSVVVNGVQTVKDEKLSGISATGAIGLMGETGEATEFASIFVRELK
jgi:hypothetical protein